ncbi:MAG TPA: Imm1 family immunity protein [Actinokineospora sp.]|jgi:hypothetical protein|nr:Imm1 family immunity protein [Actinokineospora sp.]
MNAIKAFHRQEHGNAGVLLATLTDVQSFLDELRAESIKYDAPLLAQLYVFDNADTPELSLGVHNDRGVLRFTSAASPGPWYSLGDESLGDDEIDYSYMDNATPFQMDNHVPYEDIRRAAEHFFESRGARPTAIQWRKYA